MKAGRREFMHTVTAAAAAVACSGRAASSAAAQPAAGPVAPVPSTSRAPFETELFLDNQMLASTPGVTRRLHPAKKHLLNLVVRPERWCEGTYIQPYTTMYDADQQLFKMWARAGTDAKTGYVGGNAAWMLYYTSQDGVQWERPEVGAVELAGRRDHNVVFTSDLVPQSPTRRSYGHEPFIVPRTDLQPQGKKAFFWGVNKHPRPRDSAENYVALGIVQDHRRGAHIVTSPDGIRWSCAAAPFWQTPHDVMGSGDDCLMHLMFDDAKGKWVIYRRIIPEFSERMIANASDLDRRIVDRYNRSYAYAESEDLKQWTNHQHIWAMDADDPADTELYQLGCHKFGAIYVAYASIFHLRRPQPIDIQLATSRDGIHFTRVCRGTPFIAAGPLGYYDFMAMACSQPQPILVNDTLYIYYAALNFPHDANESESAHYTGGAALATLKRDRFASLETGPADAEPCRVITQPMVVRHPRLYLNAATWEKGSIHVEVLTRDWQPIPGFAVADARAIQGDALDHPVTWTGHADMSKLMGQEVRLKFHMTRARLHAVTLSDEPRPLGAVESAYRTDVRGDSTPREN